MPTELRQLVDKAETVQAKAAGHYDQAQRYADMADAAEAAGNQALAENYLVLADAATKRGDDASADLDAINEQIYELTGNTIDPETGEAREGHPEHGFVRPDTARGELERRGVDTTDLEDDQLAEAIDTLDGQAAAENQSDGLQAQTDYLDKLTQEAHNVDADELPADLRQQVIDDAIAEETGVKHLVEHRTGWNYEDLSPAQRQAVLDEAAAEQTGAKAAVEQAAGAAWSDLTDAQRQAALRNVAFNQAQGDAATGTDTPPPAVTPGRGGVETTESATITPAEDTSSDDDATVVDTPAESPDGGQPAAAPVADESAPPQGSTPAQESAGARGSAPGQTTDIQNETVITAGQGQGHLLAPYLTYVTADGTMYNYQDGLWVDEYGEAWYVADASGKPVLIGTEEGDALLAEREGGGDQESETDTESQPDANSTEGGDDDGSDGQDDDDDDDDDDDGEDAPEEEASTAPSDESDDEDGDPDESTDSTPNPEGDQVDPRKAAEFKATPVGAESAERDEDAIEMAIGGGLLAPPDPESQPLTAEELKLAEQGVAMGRGGGHTDPIDEDAATSVGEIDEVRAKGGGVVDPPETSGEGKGGGDPLGGDPAPAGPKGGGDGLAFGTGDHSIIIGSKGGGSSPEPGEPDVSDGDQGGFTSIPDPTGPLLETDDALAGTDLRSELLTGIGLDVEVDVDELDIAE